MNKLPEGRCACHEPTVKWCGRHGEPLKLRPSERIISEDDFAVLKHCIDPAKGEDFALICRRAMSGHIK